MPRLPLYLPEGSLLEMTARTVQGRKLFRPSLEMSERILGILGRALSMYEAKLHAFVYLSNHHHMLVTPTRADEAWNLVGYMNRNTALLAKKLTGFDGVVWERTRLIPVIDDGASIQRLRYILANGVKEGLVASPLDWPGPSSTWALVNGEPIDARWRPLSQPFPEPTDPVFPIELAPLPCLGAMTPEARRALLSSVITEIEDETRHLRGDRPVLGAAALMAQDPLEETPLESHGAPTVHASDAAAYRRYMSERAAFLEDFKRSSDSRTPRNPCHLPEVPRTSPEVRRTSAE
jgi:REP element-mobilizing transposase RayT